jgi:hypothetical protein
MIRLTFEIEYEPGLGPGMWAAKCVEFDATDYMPEPQLALEAAAEMVRRIVYAEMHRTGGAVTASEIMGRIAEGRWWKTDQITKPALVLVPPDRAGEV